MIEIFWLNTIHALFFSDFWCFDAILWLDCVVTSILKRFKRWKYFPKCESCATISLYLKYREWFLCYLDLWTQREERVGRIEKVVSTYRHYYVCNRWLVGSRCVTQESQPGALWWAIGVESGVGNGRGVQERGNICIHMAGSWWCTAENSTAS